MSAPGFKTKVLCGAGVHPVSEIQLHPTLGAVYCGEHPKLMTSQVPWGRKAKTCSGEDFKMTKGVRVTVCCRPVTEPEPDSETTRARPDLMRVHWRCRHTKSSDRKACGCGNCGATHEWLEPLPCTCRRTEFCRGLDEPCAIM